MKYFLSSLILSSLILCGCNQVDVKASMEKAKQLIKDQKLDEAEKVINPCLPAAKNSPQILVLAALSKANKKKKEDFLTIIGQAKEAFKDSEDDQSLTLLGRACIEAKKYESAISFLEQSLNVNGDDLYTVALLIHAEYNFHQPKLRSYSLKNKHLNKAKKFVELRESIQFYNLTAITQVVNPNFDIAKDRFEVEGKLMKAMMKDQKDPATLLNLAVVYDIYFQKKQRAYGLYGQYLKAVKLLPPDHTQAEKVQRRMTVLQSEI